ncbi:MAG: GNAT family N-acetyltransferase [Oscillospiraceae bacterium]|nr:GNAT family N-acetyltransferase [Oscillospiraceae bacterium]MBQ9838507.1 GNAT family N-acetyltransferase [Oscillospiraceae bacterium]
MLQYRTLQVEEAERIAEIDATNFIKNVWRRDGSGEYQLTEINWTDRELPNGYAWHLRHFRNTLANGGTAFGCFDGGMLVGYATVEGSVFGQQGYVLLDQLFVSNPYRGRGIGKALFVLCAERARSIGAKKIYLCAGSSENTIAFYGKLGCRAAAEPNQTLQAEDPRDIQLEFPLK